MISLRRKKCLFAMFLLAVLKAALIFAQSTIHVPADAPTIQDGINASQNGDTVLVSPGTYNENLNFNGKTITVTTGATSYSGATATIINGSTDGPVVTFGTNEPAAAVLNGFTVQNGHSSKAGVNGGGISISGASPSITNNIVTNNFGCGIFVFNNASPLIQGNDIKQTSVQTEGSQCVVANPGAGAAAGLGIVYAGSVQVIGNIIEENDNTGNSGSGCSASGVSILYGSQVLLKGNTIRNNKAECDAGIGEALGAPVSNLLLIENLIYGNTSPNESASSIQVFVSGTADGFYPTVTEVNNTIYGLGQELLLSFGPSTITNNIIIETATSPITGLYGGLWCADPGSQKSPLTLSYNDIFNFGTPIPTTCTLSQGNLSVDPVFLDSANGDFHEQPTSPTVAAGDLNAPMIPSADLDNKSRTFCDKIDMGAYELHSHPPIALTSSANPAPGGSSLTFAAQLTGSCSLIPTANVTFLDGGTAIGVGNIDNSGLAELATSFLVVGQHNITAHYPGDFNFDDGTSPVLMQTITGDPTATSMAISPNPASAFSPITLSSVVTSPYVTPNGSVVFTAGGATLATAALDASGHASASVSSLGGGSYSITANYPATTLFHASSSAPVVEKVIGLSTSTALTASPNPAAVTQVVTFTATVQDTQGSTVPTGNITLMDGTTPLGTATLNASGAATFSVSTLSFGTHTMTANYAGSASFNPSSATLIEAVNLVATGLTLTASPNPVNTGQAVTLTATANSAFSGMVPIGLVTFQDGLTALGTAPLNDSGIATFSTASLAVGTHPLQAVFTASSSFAGSASSVVHEVVQAYDFTINTSRSSLSIPSGDWSIMTVTITPVGGFSGSVLLSCDGVPDHTQCVFPGGAKVSVAAGAQTVQLAVNTSDVYGYGSKVSRVTMPSNGRGRAGGVLAAVLLLPTFGLLGLVGCRRFALRSLWKVGVALSVLAMTVAIQSCSGKDPAETASGTYSMTVIGASIDGTSLRHTVPLELVVTP